MSDPRPFASPKTPDRARPIVSPSRWLEDPTSPPGTIPTGFEHRLLYMVYQAVDKSRPVSPSRNNPNPIPTPPPPSRNRNDDEPMIGTWSHPFSITTNPHPVWAFPNDKIPETLPNHSKSHPMGFWGTIPELDTNGLKKVLFVPPNQNPPSKMTPKGMWTFPLTARHEHILRDDQAAFLQVGEYVPKQESLDVSGQWRLLCHRPGEDEEEEKKKKAPPPKPKDIKIQVQNNTGVGKPNIILRMKPTKDTIGDIKDRIKDKIGIPPNEQRLRPNDDDGDDPTYMDNDGPTLEEAGIKDGDILVLDPMEIYVQDRKTGDTYTVSPVQPSQTIRNVRGQLDNLLPSHAKSKDPNRPRELTFRNRPCNDNKTLTQHMIEHKSTLFLEPDGMEIYVKDRKTGDTYTLTPVEPTHTIQDIKDQLLDMLPVSVLGKDGEFPPRELTFRSRPCVDKQTLKQHGIENKATLFLEPEPMEIHVQDRKTGDTYTLCPVQPSRTIKEIREQLNNLLPPSARDRDPSRPRELTFQDKPCVDNKTLKQHGIEHGSTLFLEPEPMEIYVKDRKTGETYKFCPVEPTQTVGEIRDQLDDLLPPSARSTKKDRPRELTFQSKPCDDDKTLKQHGIEDQSTLFLEPEPMEIYVQDRKTGDVYPLCPVEPNQTIGHIRDQLDDALPSSARSREPSRPRELTFKSRPCDDDKTLKQHGIEDKSTLFLEPEKMTVHVRVPPGRNSNKEPKVISFDVEPDDTIESLQEKIQDKEDIPIEDQRLFFKDRPLEDPEATFDDEDIHHGDILDLAEEPMIVYVQPPHGAEKLAFEVQPTDTIRSIKKRVEVAIDIPVKDQYMRFEGEELPDNSATLEDLGIEHEDTIDLDPMHIIVRDWKGKTFEVPCKPEDTIDDIKDKIEDLEGHPKPIQVLLKDDKVLRDPKTLDDCGIKHKDVIDLDRMKIFVEDENGKVFPLLVNPDEPIEDVKHKIAMKEGHPVPKQVLKFQDTPLDNPKGLDDYGIGYKCWVDLSIPVEVILPPDMYSVKLTPYKSPFEQTYVSPKPKHKGIRHNTKIAYKDRWHADLETENAELARAADERRKNSKK